MTNKIDPHMFDMFVQSAFLRHRIYCLKEFGVPKPWTENPVFQQYYFCNVFRRIDKTSKWIIDNVIDPYAGDPDLWKKIIIARYISRIDTLEMLKAHGGFDKIKYAQSALRTHKDLGGKVVTNAFVVNSKTTDGYADKITHLFRTIKFLSDTYFDLDTTLQLSRASLEETYNRLLIAPGCGPFMSYQYVCDMAYSSRYLMDAPDTNTWAQLGIGAMRGMNRILGNTNIRAKVPGALDFTNELLGLWQQRVRERLNDEGSKTARMIDSDSTRPENGSTSAFITHAYHWFTVLKMCDVQHWLCEFDKYMRGGSKKRRYKGV